MIELPDCLLAGRPGTPVPLWGKCVMRKREGMEERERRRGQREQDRKKETPRESRTARENPGLLDGQEGKSRQERRQEEQRARQREQQRAFLDGLARYRRRGIPILIDGKECAPEEYQKIFEFREDGSFYMGDYIGADTGMLTEIRFDRVYYR